MLPSSSPVPPMRCSLAGTIRAAIGCLSSTPPPISSVVCGMRVLPETMTSRAGPSVGRKTHGCAYYLHFIDVNVIRILGNRSPPSPSGRVLTIIRSGSVPATTSRGMRTSPMPSFAERTSAGAALPTSDAVPTSIPVLNKPYFPPTITSLASGNRQRHSQRTVSGDSSTNRVTVAPARRLPGSPCSVLWPS